MMKRLLVLFALLLPAPAMAQGIQIMNLPPSTGSATPNGTEYVPVAQNGSTFKMSVPLMVGAPIEWGTQAAHTVWAGPASGTGLPSWRVISPADFPVIAGNTVFGNATNASATPLAVSLPSCSAANNFLQYTLGTGFGCLGVAAGGSPNQIQYNMGGVFGGFTMAGDCTIVVSTGMITCTKSGGVAFGTAAFDNTGTSGPTIPLNNGGFTQSGLATFSSVANFLGPFEISSIAQAFPASGLLVGTTDVQVLTNKTVDGVTPQQHLAARSAATAVIQASFGGL